MSELYFLIKYTPFWSIPMCLLFLEFGYLSKVKKKRKHLMICIIGALLTGAMTAFYYWVGGPKKSVSALREFVQYITN